MAASSSFATRSTPWTHDVFISFRGEDTRNNFTSHLHAALRRKNLGTYVDGRLDRGQEISPALLQAIKESRVAVVIFSGKYASSSWCLDGLVHILKCKERDGQIVIPVFYHVDPSDVRKVAGSYQTEFAVLEERFKDRKNKLEEWKKALEMAANLAGWSSLVTK